MTLESLCSVIFLLSSHLDFTKQWQSSVATQWYKDSSGTQGESSGGQKAI